MPEMMYDLMPLQHNKAILNWLHNATKMPCQYLLHCQYNKVLPLIYETVKERYQIRFDKVFNINACISINTGDVVQAKHCSGQIKGWMKHGESAFAGGTESFHRESTRLKNSWKHISRVCAEITFYYNSGRNLSEFLTAQFISTSFFVCVWNSECHSQPPPHNWHSLWGFVKNFKISPFLQFTVSFGDFLLFSYLAKQKFNCFYVDPFLEILMKLKI